MALLLFFKSYIPAHTRRLKNGQIVQVQSYSDKRLRKDAIPVHVDHAGIKAEDKEHWARLHKEQHVLHHADKALHERRIKEAAEAVEHHNKKAAHHEAQRDLARKNGDDAALSEHNIALTHHHNRAAAWGVKRGNHERHLAKVDAKLEGIKALKEKLWSGSGDVGEKEKPNENPTADKSDTEKKLRDLWTAQGVSKTRQDELIAQVTEKAKPGARVGPITIKENTGNSTSKPKNALTAILETGDLKSALSFLKGLNKKSLGDVLLHSGFTVTSEKTTKDLMNFVTPQLIRAAKLKTDGYRINQKITPTGKTNEVKTAKGTKVNTQFAVVEAADLTTSHDANGNANPAYPGELQPRNRGRDTSQAQITRIAKNLDPDMLGRTRNASNGAPIIGSDGIVESGNGRTLAINQAYQTGKADDYRDWLEDIADTYGLDAKQIKGMKNPVLVRVRTSDIDRAQFAREANQSDMLAMTATEKAKADANHLTEPVISKLAADGDLSSAGNRDFIMAFMGKLGDDESAGLSTTDGKPTKQLYDRAQAAIFAKAYNDDRLLELMADDAKPDIANIIKSLNQAAPSFIKARSLSEHHTQATTGKLTDAVDVSLDKQAIDAIVKATEALKKAKDSNMPIEKLIAQGDMFGGVDPVVAQMALFIKDNNKSASRMGEAFTAMADYLVHELEHSQNYSLFGDEQPINIVDVIKAANAQLEKHYGDKVKAIGSGTNGGFIDIFTETRGQKADREAFLDKEKNDEPTEISHAGYKIYPSKMKSGNEIKDVWLVQTEDNLEKGVTGFGDNIFNTLSDAKNHAEHQKASAENTTKRNEQYAKEENQAQEDKARKLDMDGFGDNSSPRDKANYAKTLDKSIRLDGKVDTLKNHVKRMTTEGQELKSFEVDKIKPMTRAAYNRASQYEQDQHEKKVRLAGKKTTYLVGDYDLGKIAFDYAKHLKQSSLKKSLAQSRPLLLFFRKAA